MENRQEPEQVEEEVHETNPNDGDLLRRLSSSVLGFRSNTKLPQRDPETLRTAFIHSAAIVFVLVCGACGLLVYRVLEPFLRSILWSILAGAFLFPFKNHLTLTTRNFLRQLDRNSNLLFYGLVILLPLQTLDRTIDAIVPFIIKRWKELLIIFIFLLLIESFQIDVIYYWLITIGYDFIFKLGFIVHLFDSLWITTIVISYLIAVLTIYDSSPLIKILLNILAIPIWFILLIYLSQFLPVNCRLIVVILSIILTVVGFIVDFREKTEENIVQL
ncbi:unnamed protein product [Rotaria sordida]|uniref:Uncharacterized protein n=1 Tax=Rotaria sordida TaxID=392033 RepID=A0A815S9C8_9BILA|nr:unnamed protein product [Rotaria sordida]